MAGLGTVEGAIFGIMGLLLAFTISGALQRFDDRRQLVLQEAAAAATAFDRLGLFEGETDLPLKFHPVAVRVSADVTPFGAV
ncbi:hypothetical protein ACVWXQ_001233 [Bradyrhizobium sp. S3.14.4]